MSCPMSKDMGSLEMLQEMMNPDIKPLVVQHCTRFSDTLAADSNFSALLQDPEVLKFLSEDMPQDFANPEMMKEMMEDPDMKPMVEEHLRNLNNVSSMGMKCV